MGSHPSAKQRKFLPGIYCPTQCFFDPETEDLDLGSISKHTVRLAKAGVVGITTNGSNGEAPYLSPEERKLVTSTTRAALDEAGFQSLPIIVGASAESVRGTVQLCKDAAESGGDAVLILVPSFFKWAMTTSAIESYFTRVADQSPLPVIIYNYPGAVAGIDLSSDTLIKLSQHPGIVGTKFTCGNVGKLARVAAKTQTTPSQSNGEQYYCLSGVADLIAPAKCVGTSGAIVGAANVFPKTCVELWNLCTEHPERGEDIQTLQALVALGDWTMTKRAVPGFKAVLDKFHGYGGIPRQPMQSLSKTEKEKLYLELEDVMKHEASL